MKKLTKQEKDKYPKIYGYGSVEQLMADPTRFGDDPNDPQTHWTYYEDIDGDIRFTPCNEEYFHFNRNEKRNEERRELAAKLRCPISIDQMYEDHDFEFADPSYEENIEIEMLDEQIEQFLVFVAECDPLDQEIIKLYSEGHTETYISEKVNMPRSTVQWRKKKTFAFLKEKMEKIR